MVSIAQITNTLKLPSYFSRDIPFVCPDPFTATDRQAGVQTLQDQGATGLLLAGKYVSHGYANHTSVPVYLPSAPRTLTRAQLYTLNQINQSSDDNMNVHLSKAPTSADILAVLPIKTAMGVATGSLLVEMGGSLQNNGRTYFGPVNIERMQVTLLDDKGRVLNLNGADWCVTLLCECLYQY